MPKQATNWIFEQVRDNNLYRLHHNKINDPTS